MIDQVMHYHVFNTKSKEYCFISAVYAANLHSLRLNLWANLHSTMLCMMFVPWLILDDFNVILKVKERSDHQDGDILSAEESFFVNCIKELEVIDCSSIRPTFTRLNKQVGNLIAKKLDRVLVNEKFMSTIPTAISEDLEPKF